MNPLFDEKFIAAVKTIVPEFIAGTIRLQAFHEAYGPSVNEGLCYESVNRISVSGDFHADIYFCLDGYTKLNLLPRIAEWKQERDEKVLSGSALMSYYVREFGLYIHDEFDSAGYKTEFSQPEDLSHRLVSIPPEDFRQYIIIFFLKDRIQKEYTGRLYIIITFPKSAF